MYKRYWQLDSRPFEPMPAGGKPFAGEGFRGALLKVRYAIESRREAVALAGASGVGKTFLVDQLSRELSETDCEIIHLRFPQLSPRELLSWIAVELGRPTESPTNLAADHSLRIIEEEFLNRERAGRHVVLAIDEAQLLEDTGLLETLRLVSNLSHDGKPLATLLLIGQPELLSMIGRLGSLAPRVAQVALLNPLDAIQTHEYVQHRLEAAGAQQDIFTTDGVEALVAQTSGVPRLINRLADLALVVGFAEGAAHVDADLIEAVTSELTLLRAA